MSGGASKSMFKSRESAVINTVAPARGPSPISSRNVADRPSADRPHATRLTKVWSIGSRTLALTASSRALATVGSSLCGGSILASDARQRMVGSRSGESCQSPPCCSVSAWSRCSRWGISGSVVAGAADSTRALGGAWWCARHGAEAGGRPRAGDAAPCSRSRKRETWRGSAGARPGGKRGARASQTLVFMPLHRPAARAVATFRSGGCA